MLVLLGAEVTCSDVSALAIVTPVTGCARASPLMHE